MYAFSPSPNVDNPKEARRFERKPTRVDDKKEEMNRSVTRLSGIASTFTRGFRSTAFVAMPIKVRSFAISVYPQFLSNASIGALQNLFTVTRCVKGEYCSDKSELTACSVTEEVCFSITEALFRRDFLFF